MKYTDNIGPISNELAQSVMLAMINIWPPQASDSRIPRGISWEALHDGFGWSTCQRCGHGYRFRKHRPSQTPRYCLRCLK